jgi:glycosyltransferase involved in cell wall biosynthesis
MSSGAGAHHLSREAPTVTVGMPTYNAAQWIGAAIESILGQSFRDFELIISDNASTDATLAVCQRYASSDARIRVVANPQNVGANKNYFAVLRAARGRYFKWASSNDLCAPTFIEQCVAALERDPAAVLAVPRTLLFQESPADARPYDRDIDLLGTAPAARFITMQSAIGLNNALNGVIRRDALARVSAVGIFTGADIVLMGELALLGKWLLLEDRLFYRRMSNSTASPLKSKQDAEHHIAPTPLRWQQWRYQFALLRATRLLPFLSRDWFQAMNYGLRSFVWARSSLAGEALRELRLHAR